MASLISLCIYVSIGGCTRNEPDRGIEGELRRTAGKSQLSTETEVRLVSKGPRWLCDPSTASDTSRRRALQISELLQSKLGVRSNELKEGFPSSIENPWFAAIEWTEALRINSHFSSAARVVFPSRSTYTQPGDVQRDAAREVLSYTGTLSSSLCALAADPLATVLPELEWWAAKGISILTPCASWWQVCFIHLEALLKRNELTAFGRDLEALVAILEKSDRSCSLRSLQVSESLVVQIIEFLVGRAEAFPTIKTALPRIAARFATEKRVDHRSVLKNQTILYYRQLMTIVRPPRIEAHQSNLASFEECALDTNQEAANFLDIFGDVVDEGFDLQDNRSCEALLSVLTQALEYSDSVEVTYSFLAVRSILLNVYRVRSSVLLGIWYDPISRADSTADLDPSVVASAKSLDLAIEVQAKRTVRIDLSEGSTMAKWSYLASWRPFIVFERADR